MTAAKKKPHPNRVPCGWIGLHKRPPRDGEPVAERRLTLGERAADLPDGVALGGAPLVPAANEAFAPEELDERIARYARRARRQLPLFRKGRRVRETVRAVCWGCGAPTPTNPGKPGSRLQAGKCPGWKVVPIPGMVGGNFVQTWCPECYAMPGFGCVEEPEPPLPGGELATRKAVSL